MLKNIISLFLSVVIVALAVAGALWLTGRFSFGNALIIGISGALAGLAAPYVVKWVKSIIVHKS